MTISKYCLLYVFLTILFVDIQAQNLVSNPGFEDYTFLPEVRGEWCAANDWWALSNVCSVSSPHGSPDYFHRNAGEEITFPKNPFGEMESYKGDAIMGVFAYSPAIDNFREYILTKFQSEILKGEKVDVSFYYFNIKPLLPVNGSICIANSGLGIKKLGFNFLKIVYIRIWVCHYTLGQLSK